MGIRVRAAWTLAVLLALSGASGRSLAGDTLPHQENGSDTVAVEPRYRAEARELARRPAVREALRQIEQEAARIVEDQIELTRIPAPPFHEEARARRYLELLAEAGADTVFLDDEGNAIGVRRGTSPARDRGAVVLSGHLDTVFPPGTEVEIRRRGDTLFAPGIGDDGRGIAEVLAVLRALASAGVRTKADLWFVGTVGEEGLGDLRGVKHLFRPGGPRIAAFLSVDGTNPGRIVNGALGSRRYRVTFRGAGGHSWGDFGAPNPAHALGLAIARLDAEAGAFTLEGPRTSYNVGRLGGGTSVNSIPFEAWMEVDMRSLDQERLLQIDSLFQGVVREALAEENAGRRKGEELRVEVVRVGDRPSGFTPPSDPLVQRAAAAAEWFGYPPRLTTSSTDANIPISRGIPAAAIGRGGESAGAHSPGEWWRDPGDAHVSAQRALLLVLAQAGIARP